MGNELMIDSDHNKCVGEDDDDDHSGGGMMMLTMMMTMMMMMMKTTMMMHLLYPRSALTLLPATPAMLAPSCQSLNFHK